MSNNSPADAKLRASYLAQYRAWLAYEKHYSDHTLSNYSRDIEYLFECAQETSLNEISRQQIRVFIAGLHKQGLGPRSLARILSGWRSFYRFLMRDCDFENNPCVGIKAPKAPKKLPQTLNPEEASQLATITNETINDIRDRAMSELLYSSGLRLSELINLNPEHLFLNSQEVRVTGKGNKTRIVPIGRFAVTALQNWLNVRHQLANPDEKALFVSSRGSRISGRMVQLKMKQWAIQQGISRNVYPHLMRHSFASHLLQSSGDLRAVQEMLGHANISTTQIYTHLDYQHLSKSYDAAHPRARKKEAEDG